MSRLDDLERRVDALEERLGRQVPGSPAPQPPSGVPVSAAAGAAAAAPSDGQVIDRFWALHTLQAQLAAHAASAAAASAEEAAGEAATDPGEPTDVDGAVLLTGSVRLPVGEAVWQETRLVPDLLGDLAGSGRERSAAALAALGSPVRLLLLGRVLSGTTATAELTAGEGLGTSGQVHHHLRQLVATGWLRATARGRYAVPADRVIPLLVALAAAAG